MKTKQQLLTGAKLFYRQHYPLIVDEESAAWKLVDSAWKSQKFFDPSGLNREEVMRKLAGKN